MTAPVFEHALVTRFPAEYKACSHDRNTYLAPLYCYPNDRRVRELFESYPPGKEERRPNLNPAFVEALTERLSLPFDFNASATEGVVTPEDVLHYLYALLHSPTYRTRFAPFLRLDFPRLPLPPDAEAFWELAQLGADLVALHLLDDDYPFASWVKAKRPSPLASFPLAFPVAGSDKIERVRYDEETQRLFINARQFFEGVPPEVWDFRVGGYRVLEKWLAERKGQRLGFDDQRQIARLVKLIGETLRLMAAIDEATQWLTG
jgi:predicted helicase